MAPGAGVVTGVVPRAVVGTVPAGTVVVAGVVPDRVHTVVIADVVPSGVDTVVVADVVAGRVDTVVVGGVMSGGVVGTVTRVGPRRRSRHGRRGNGVVVSTVPASDPAGAVVGAVADAGHRG